MTLTFHALWMLCGLSGAVFATYVGSATTARHPSPATSARAAVKRRGFPWLAGRQAAWLALALGFVLASAWLRSGRALDAAWVGGLVAGVAAAELVSPSRAAVMTFAAGALSALWASLLHLQGWPQPLATVSAAALPVASAYLSQRTAVFAPPVLQEEALVAMLAFGLVVAVAPEVAQGWQSALALNLGGAGASLPLVPAWMVGVAGASTALGALWSLWRRG